MTGSGGTGHQDHSGTSGFCRDCLAPARAGEARCLTCHSPRLLRHQELDALAIGHIDCDAFYAAVEKRDDPSLAGKPVIIGGQKRGVVATACYIARVNGVHSAMPMFKAKRACPQAVIIRPDMAKYVKVGRQVRAMMQELTPLVEPVSIDEAFLDLSGTRRLHHASPARALADLARRIQEDIGISVSIGLSHNKFLAKIASDLDKPRGFSVIGRSEAKSFLAQKPVRFIWGVGKAMAKALARDGITMIGQLQAMDKAALMRRYGSMGARLYHLSRGEDDRKVEITGKTKSISAETTFNSDVSKLEDLERSLWQLCEKVSRRAKASRWCGQTVTLKLKTADFKQRTRNTTLVDATVLAGQMFAAGRQMLEREADGTQFRLIGIGISHLHRVEGEAFVPDLDDTARQKARAELAMDKVRERFGNATIGKGRSFRPSAPGKKDNDE